MFIRKHRGFALADLLVLSVVTPLLLGTILLGMASNTHSGGNRTKCASNLRQIGLAIQMYANENKGAFPRTNFDPDSGALITTNQGWDVATPFAAEGPSPVGDNNVTASLFLLMRTQDLTSEVFICPSSDGERDNFNGHQQGPAGQSNFSDIANLRYSYIVPFPTKAAQDLGFKLNFTLTSDFAIAADMNPGGQALVGSRHDWPRNQMMQINSNNHNGDGQNVLYADGHVEFQNNPFCGMVRPTGYNDNIYTAGTGAAEVVTGQPADNLDTILLPVDPAGPRRHAPSAPGAADTLFWLGVAVGMIILVTTLILLMAKRSSSPITHQAPPVQPPGA